MGFPLCLSGHIRFTKIQLPSLNSGVVCLGPFSLHRGMWQGCPLSPSLFAIAMEPVAEALRTSLEIKGLRIDWLEERVALYADDLLFLNDQSLSLEGHSSDTE